MTSVRWDDAPAGPRVLHFALSMFAEGVRIERTWDTLGLRANGSHTVVLEEVFVPDAAVSLDRPADVWHPVWNVILGAARPLILAAYVGIADAFAAHALSRKTVAADALIATVRLAIEATGGAGYTRSSDLERLYRDVPGAAREGLRRQGFAHRSSRRRRIGAGRTNMRAVVGPFTRRSVVRPPGAGRAASPR